MMKRVADTAKLANAIGRVARSRAGYTTNFFAAPADTARWIASGALSLLQDERAVLILRRDANFQRLYHVASDTAALSSALGALDAIVPATTIVTDLIGKCEGPRSVVNAHAGNGFMAYARLLRMHRLAQPPGEEWRSDPGVVQARAGDAQRIHAFFDKQLDPYSEQVPEGAQLNDAVAKGAVLVVEHGSELAGVLIHATAGLTTTLRYWHVDERFRNLGVGAKLMRTFLRLCADSRRILLWVIAGNDNAISRYRHYGFQDDSLADDIMVKYTGLAQR